MVYHTAEQREQILRISFGWLILGVMVIIFLGMLGGIIASQLWIVRQPPLIPEQHQLVSTVQEVTISPNQAAASIVDKTHRSVVALAFTPQDSSVSFLGMGVLFTNDGVIASPVTVPRGARLVAYDFRGVQLQLDYIGKDSLYNINWWRVRDGVFAPFELSAEDPPVGSVLLAVARTPEHFQPRSSLYQVNSYGLPLDEAPAGWQRIVYGSLLTPDETLVGSPLLDEEGKLAAVVINPAAGMALTVSELRESLQRLTGSAREFNPLEELGISIHYRFIMIAAGSQHVFSAEVTAVRPESAATRGGLKKGDYIIAINDESLEWQKKFLTMVSQKLPFKLTVLRGAQEHVLTLQQQPSTSPL